MSPPRRFRWGFIPLGLVLIGLIVWLAIAGRKPAQARTPPPVPVSTAQATTQDVPLTVTALGAAPLAMIANGGMAVAVSGIEQVVAIDMQLFEFDKLYINPLYGQCRPFVDFPVLLSLYDQGRLKLDEMVTRTYPLSAAGLSEAFADMKGGVGAKGVLIPQSRS